MTVVTKASAYFVEYNGKEIFHLDYSNKKNMYDLIDAIEQSVMYFKIHIEGHNKNNILLLVDLTNSMVFGKAVDKLRESIKALNNITNKRAIVGLNKSKQLFLNVLNSMFGKDVKAFNDIGEAKKWLVE
jgi:hypothetical protein